MKVKKGICWGCIPGTGADLQARLEAAKEAGFDGVELSVTEPGEGPLTLETSEREAAELRAQAATIGVELPSVMAGGAVRSTPILHPDAAVRAACVEKLGRTLERAKWVGATAALLHPGQLKPETRYDEAWEWTREALKATIPHAERHGVALAIENVWNKFLLSPREMQQMIDEVGHPLIGTYFDVGNCILYGFPEQWVAILGQRIKKVHVKDFKRAVGTGAGFCQLLDGDADYAAVIRALREAGYDDYLTSEVSVRNMPEGQGIADTARRIDQILAM
ncbi:MAG TPA: sugar phosphate isomerase/epimerase family protein [Chloroflexota bacterium]|jgi:L-ribulose-5-phosphate 3-epimerase|nr:sugar phosphate isomerase/epimerase family protein [Chloroflexota bacterium]